MALDALGRLVASAARDASRLIAHDSRPLATAEGRAAAARLAAAAPSSRKAALRDQLPQLDGAFDGDGTPSLTPCPSGATKLAEARVGAEY